MTNPQHALKALDREAERARRAIALERALAAAAVPAGAALAWAALALAGALDLAPPVLVSAGSFAIWIALAALIVRALRRRRSVTAAEARRRLAEDSGLEPADLDALDDRPLRLDPLSLALWSKEGRRALDLADRVRARAPRLARMEGDRFGLRFLVPLLVLALALTAGERAADRLALAFVPDPGPMLGDRPLLIEAWATPADYTGAPPVSLSDRLGQTVPTPPGPEVTVRVTGPKGAPWLTLAGPNGKQRVPFKRAVDGAFEAKLAADAGGELRVVRFRTKARWRLAPAPDAPPTAAWAAPPETLAGEQVRVNWSVADDYGVRGLALRAVPVKPLPGRRGRAAIVDIPIQLPLGDPKSASGEAELSLAEHPYAGLAVEAQIVAIDAAGQEGLSAPVTLVLPEKPFSQPLARAAIEIRRTILHERRPYADPGRFSLIRLLGPLTGRGRAAGEPLALAPEGVQRAVELTDSLTMEPQADTTFGDLAVFAGFALARAQLTQARAIEDTDVAADVLWLVALRVEFGDSVDEREAFEQARRALMEAIARGANAETIRQLSEALAAATMNLVDALAREALREGRVAEAPTEGAPSLGPSDIQRMTEEIQRRAEAGDARGAQEALDQLAQLMAGLQVQVMMGSGGEGAENDLQRRLGEEIGRQRALNDETDRAQANPEADGQQRRQGLADRQDLLARSVQELEERAQGQAGRGQGGQALDDAREAMGRAAQALREGDMEGAQAAQDQALRGLRDGAAALARQQARQGAQKAGATGERGQTPAQGQALDPLGRAIGAGTDGGSTTVPVEAEQQRVREIMDELRRRIQDPQRPKSERDYLRRLLERFED